MTVPRAKARAERHDIFRDSQPAVGAADIMGVGRRVHAGPAKHAAALVPLPYFPLHPGRDIACLSPFVFRGVSSSRILNTSHIDP